MSVIGGLCGAVLNETLAAATLFASAGMIDALFYGIHVILFFLCIFLLIRKRRLRQWPIFVPALAMFILSTVDFALTFRIISWAVPKVNSDPNRYKLGMRLVQGKDTLFVASNFVAELTLVYRCYIIWAQSKYVLLSVLVVVADTVWGFLGMGPTLLATDPNRFVHVYVWSLFAINVVLTSITVTRVIWISKLADRVPGQGKQVASYHTAAIILVETGLIYSVSLLIYLVYPSSNANKVYLIVIAMRLVGIMPTLLIVQVALGGIRQNTGGRLTTLSKFQARRRTNSIVLDTLASMHHDLAGSAPPDIREETATSVSDIPGEDTCRPDTQNDDSPQFKVPPDGMPVP